MTDWTSLVVAVVGVAGTASGAIISQRAALKAEALRTEAQRKDHEAELRETADHVREERLREMYKELNTKARHYRGALMDVLAHLSGERVNPNSLGALETARQAFAECNSRSQMLVPWSIVGQATAASVALGDGYRAGTTEGLGGWSDVQLERHIRGAVNSLRDAMRADLGIDGPTEES